jgi:ribonuclease BN (tRNA processing enzyme)
MELSLTCLACGRNGSGHSAIIAVSSPESIYSKEVKVHEKILINTGDSTVRICTENAVKLRQISCIIITSLAPQNIGGLPGLISFRMMFERGLNGSIRSLCKYP